MQRPTKETCRILENNELVYAEVERSRAHIVGLDNLTKKEAAELNLLDAWKEYKTLELEIEKLSLELDEEVELNTTEPVMDPDDEYKMMNASRPRGGAVKGSIPEATA